MDLTTQDWINAGLATSSLLLALATAGAALAALKTARAAKEQMFHMERQANAAEEEVQISREALRTQTSPRLAVCRTENHVPEIAYSPGFDDSGYETDDGDLVIGLRNAGLGDGHIVLAEVQDQEAHSFPATLDTETRHVPGRERHFFLYFPINRLAVANATELLLILVYESPDGTSEKMRLRASPGTDLTRWVVVDDEVYD